MDEVEKLKKEIELYKITLKIEQGRRIMFQRTLTEIKEILISNGGDIHTKDINYQKNER